MITIINKKDCCGCNACVQKCPKHCIEMQTDEEGFWYPHVDLNACIRCGLCEQVCPVINQYEARKPLRVYAAKNPNETIRMQSSSGGIFTSLAEAVIKDGGVVFGAKFDLDWNVIHAYTETIDGLADFRGSKYVQSNIGDCYKQAEQFLRADRKVLFSGTPCQIAGLKHYLGRDCENLILVDVVCHGVPSPLVWRKYLKAMDIDETKRIYSISFRDKNKGWNNYSLKVAVKDIYSGISTELFCESKLENIYLIGFIRDVFLRPSCFACKFKQSKSTSDITLADFWGIESINNDFCDNKGTSCVLVNSLKGIDLLNSINISKSEYNIQDFTYQNPSYLSCHDIPKKYNNFWSSFLKNGCIYALKNNTNPPVIKRLRSWVIQKMQKLGVFEFVLQLYYKINSK